MCIICILFPLYVFNALFTVKSQRMKKKRPQMLRIICKTVILLKIDFSLSCYIPTITLYIHGIILFSGVFFVLYEQCINPVDSIQMLQGKTQNHLKHNNSRLWTLKEQSIKNGFVYFSSPAPKKLLLNY